MQQINQLQGNSNNSRITDEYPPRIVQTNTPAISAMQYQPSMRLQPTYANEIKLPTTKNTIYEGCLDFWGDLFGWLLINIIKGLVLFHVVVVPSKKTNKKVHIKW